MILVDFFFVQRSLSSKRTEDFHFAVTFDCKLIYAIVRFGPSNEMINKLKNINKMQIRNRKILHPKLSQVNGVEF